FEETPSDLTHAAFVINHQYSDRLGDVHLVGDWPWHSVTSNRRRALLSHGNCHCQNRMMRAPTGIDPAQKQFRPRAALRTVCSRYHRVVAAQYSRHWI